MVRWQLKGLSDITLKNYKNLSIFACKNQPEKIQNLLTMKRPQIVTIFGVFFIMFFCSCFVVRIEPTNRRASYNRAIKNFNYTCLTAKDLDSLYCNLNLFIETLSSFYGDFESIKFSNKGLEKIRNELLSVYLEYRESGTISSLEINSEIELRERVGQYLKLVIKDAKSGNLNYENRTIRTIYDGKPNKFNKRRD
jgi:hypothetical protein